MVKRTRPVYVLRIEKEVARNEVAKEKLEIPGSFHLRRLYSPMDGVRSVTRKAREIRFLNETLTMSQHRHILQPIPVTHSHDTMRLMDGDVYRGSPAREIRAIDEN